jgi:hypothetical protein
VSFRDPRTTPSSTPPDPTPSRRTHPTDRSEFERHQRYWRDASHHRRDRQVGSGGVTNNGTLALEGTAELTINGAVTNSGPFDLDTNYGDGGGNQTIDGTLANTFAVQVGKTSSNLSAATILTRGGLTHPSGASLALYGSASHPATLSFSGSGAGVTTNGGTFVLSDTAPVTLTDSTFTTGNTHDLDSNSGDGGSPTIGGMLGDGATVQTASPGQTPNAAAMVAAVAAATTAPTLTTLVSFDGTNGKTPDAGLIADATGDLFGTTAAGGANGDGTVFENSEDHQRRLWGVDNIAQLQRPR